MRYGSSSSRHFLITLPGNWLRKTKMNMSMSTQRVNEMHTEWMDVNKKFVVDGGLALLSLFFFAPLSSVFNLNLWACNEMIVVWCIVCYHIHTY